MHSLNQGYLISFGLLSVIHFSAAPAYAHPGLIPPSHLTGAPHDFTPFAASAAAAAALSNPVGGAGPVEAWAAVGSLRGGRGVGRRGRGGHGWVVGKGRPSPAISPTSPPTCLPSPAVSAASGFAALPLPPTGPAGMAGSSSFFGGGDFDQQSQAGFDQRSQAGTSIAGGVGARNELDETQSQEGASQAPDDIEPRKLLTLAGEFSLFLVLHFDLSSFFV